MSVFAFPSTIPPLDCEDLDRRGTSLWNLTTRLSRGTTNAEAMKILVHGQIPFSDPKFISANLTAYSSSSPCLFFHLSKFLRVQK
jgi:hypothetical protein